jgi:hypothetical protein
MLPNGQKGSSTMTHRVILAEKALEDNGSIIKMINLKCGLILSVNFQPQNLFSSRRLSQPSTQTKITIAALAE